VALGFILLVDALRDVFDPSLLPARAS